jgi:hypothetical protein
MQVLQMQDLAGIVDSNEKFRQALKTKKPAQGSAGRQFFPTNILSFLGYPIPALNYFARRRATPPQIISARKLNPRFSRLFFKYLTRANFIRIMPRTQRPHAEFQQKSRE